MCSAGYGSVEVWGLIPNGDVTSKKRGFDGFTDTLFPSKSCCLKKTNHVYPYGISQYPIIVPPQYPVKKTCSHTSPIANGHWTLTFKTPSPSASLLPWGTWRHNGPSGWSWHAAKIRWKMQKKNHGQGHHLASDNICRRHCPQSTPCSWRGLKPE